MPFNVSIESDFLFAVTLKFFFSNPISFAADQFHVHLHFGAFAKFSKYFWFVSRQQDLSEIFSYQNSEQVSYVNNLLNQ